MKVSIFLINYNNAELLKKSINSVLKQNYKNIEIIVYDDKSTDNSRLVLKNFSGIKKIYGKFKSKKGYLGQINGIKECLKISTGHIICFLDSDDLFAKNKITEVVKYHNKSSCNLFFDKPILFKKNKQYFFKYNKASFRKKYLCWPYLPPQSCITVKKEFLQKYIKYLDYKKFEHVWFDFRISILSYLINDKINFIGKYLTYYRVTNNSVSSGYIKFSRIWWNRRLQAHQYIFYLVKKKILKKNPFMLDYILTKMINFIL